MNGLAIWSDISNSVCATGFTFYFNDGTSMSLGSNLGTKTSILTFSKSNRLSLVTSPSENSLIIDVLQICTISGACIKAGNLQFKNLKNNLTIDSNWNIMGFWGSTYRYTGAAICLFNFGVTYYI